MASKYFVQEPEQEQDPILAGLNTAQSIAVTNPAPVVQILAPRLISHTLFTIIGPLYIDG
jgi:hypothetical protein